MKEWSGAIDDAGALPLRVTCDDTTNTWYVTLDISRSSRMQTNEHLLSFLSITSGNANAAFERQESTLVARLPFILDEECTLRLNHRPVAAWGVTEKCITETLGQPYRLTVFETRMLGQFPHPCLPYGRTLLSHVTTYPRTDLHTHLTSQIRSHALLRVAAQAGACYPLELLRLIGVDGENLSRHLIPSTPFTPAASDGLLCEKAGEWVEGVKIADLMNPPELANALAASMEIAADNVITFDDLERRIYRMRNPLTKNPDVVAGMIAEVARDYAAQGIVYAELSVTAALSPDWLASALPALRAAEAETGVALRLLAALPRSLPPIAALAQLEMVQHIAENPYIVGIDFLGYEANKTRNFGWALSHIARFAAAQRQGIDRRNTGWKFADDFILRVHAGENGKNPDNVAEVLEIAEKHGVRVRVGHAAYGNKQVDRARAERLAEAGLLMIEFNPDSNMAMNNIDRAEQLPMKEWATVPFVIASDGAGVYQTDNRQLLAASLFAGLEKADVAKLHSTEDAHIAYQSALFTRKSAAYQARYASDADFVEYLREVFAKRTQQDALSRLRHKTPLLIAGASGSSWARIDEEWKRAITEGIRQLVALLNPEKVYFAMGRVKQEGIGQALDAALRDAQANNPTATPFDVVGMLSGHQNMPTLAEHINHIVPLSGELMSVPTHMTQLLKTHGGSALYIGGSAFTRDFITRSAELGIPFGVMAKVAGASGEKAEVLDARYVFHGAEGMVAHARAMLGEDAFR
jgi:Adenosine deaminase